MVISYWLLGGSAFQVVHVTVEESDGLTYQLTTAINEFIGQQIFVVTGNQVVENFPARTASVAAEFGVVQIVKTTVTLSNIGGRRASCAQELIAHSVAFLFGQPKDNFTGNKSAQFAARFPTFQVFKMANLAGSNLHLATLSNQQRSPPLPLTDNQ